MQFSVWIGSQSNNNNNNKFVKFVCFFQLGKLSDYLFVLKHSFLLAYYFLVCMCWKGNI